MDTFGYMNKFIIEGKLPSLNTYTKTNRGNKYLANKLKQETQNSINKYIVIAISRGFLKKVNKYPCRLKITWYEPNNKRDIDNITFATKFILDSMVCMGIIEDDSRKYVDSIEHIVFTDKENPRIEVEINEPMCTD